MCPFEHVHRRRHVASPASTESTHIVADELIQRCDRVRLPVCRSCRHCVGPDPVAQHLQSARHRLGRVDARRVQATVGGWPDLVGRDDPLPEVDVAVPAIPELRPPIPWWLCQIAPDPMSIHTYYVRKTSWSTRVRLPLRDAYATNLHRVTSLEGQVENEPIMDDSRWEEQ
jgi:hypothetical protein